MKKRSRAAMARAAFLAHRRWRAELKRRRAKHLKRIARRFILTASLARELQFLTTNDVRAPHGSYGRFLGREFIMLPENLSLRENRTETLTAIAMMRDAVFRQDKQSVLFFDRVENLEPAATMLLCAEIYRCKGLKRRGAALPVIGNYPESPKVYAQLKEMGFFRMLEVAEPDDVPSAPLDDERPIFLRFETSARVEAELAARFSDLVTKGVFEMEPLTKTRMVAAIKEAMGNANEHAYVRPGMLPAMRHRWWMAGHLDILKREMMVIILDLGIGIPNKLEPHTFERIVSFLHGEWVRSGWSVRPTDAAMIAAATELRRTSTGASGRGRGFRDMKRFVDLCDAGELRVLSNRGSYVYTKAKASVDDYGDTIGGTLIEWRVQHDSVASIVDG